MDAINNLIHTWIKGLIQKNINNDLIDPLFFIEEGMTLNEYIQYEQEQFNSLSDIYDLDENFSIKILAQQPFIENKQIVFFYIINSINKIVCKMSMTICLHEHKLSISSNNYYSQLVPKYSLQYNAKNNSHSISHIALAIKSPYDVIDIISPNFQLQSLTKGENYEQDSFYHAKFIIDEEVNFNTFTIFHIILKDGEKNIKEKRKIFFDVIEEDNVPFFIDNEALSVINKNYPVHLSYWNKTNSNYNFEYPRNLTVSLSGITKITVTDSLDNDWNIIL